MAALLISVQTVHVIARIQGGVELCRPNCRRRSICNDRA